MRRGRGYIWNILLLVLALLVISEVFLPRLAGRRLREILESNTTAIGQLDLQVNSFPALKILRGRLDRVEISGKGILSSNLYFDSLSLKYRNISLKDGTFQGENTYLHIEISEDSLNDYLQASYDELERFKLRLHPDQVYLVGEIVFLGTSINLELSGRLRLTAVNQVSFIPENISLQDISISLDLLRSQLGELGFAFDLNQLDIPLRVDRVELQSGRLVIRGNEALRKAESE